MKTNNTKYSFLSLSNKLEYILNHFDVSYVEYNVDNYVMTVEIKRKDFERFESSEFAHFFNSVSLGIWVKTYYISFANIVRCYDIIRRNEKIKMIINE